MSLADKGAYHRWKVLSGVLCKTEDVLYPVHKTSHGTAPLAYEGSSLSHSGTTNATRPSDSPTSSHAHT